ncbi:MAG: putative calcium/sodium:proton antiporter [Methanomassiliicoccales archaeon PtaU1.Bin124]|nr:MAG: putative calcium/sodium:proton antiporter [Methanomassiliicoccales archaeon PtaU1.Bin124]
MDILTFIISLGIILIGCEFFTNGVEWAGKKFHLSEGAVGSVLAAVGTALPETVIPIIAIFFMSTGASEEIGVGSILGAPFMLATLALFVCGLSVLIFAKKRKRKTLKVCGQLMRRDLKFFLIAYSIAVVAAFLPADLHEVHLAIGCLLVPIYVVYVYYTMKTGETCADDEVDPLYICKLTDKVELRGGKVIDGLLDPVERKIDSVLRTKEPDTWEIILQIILSLGAIILGANIFVEQIELMSHSLGIQAIVLALLIVPIATELPEKFNSFLWIREGKDTFAIGNITGAMVFQSCIPVTIGILMTNWAIDLSDKGQMLQALSIFIAMLSAVILFFEARKDEIHVRGLMLGGALYAVFIGVVLFA